VSYGFFTSTLNLTEQTFEYTGWRRSIDYWKTRRRTPCLSLLPYMSFLFLLDQYGSGEPAMALSPYHELNLGWRWENKG